METEAGIRRAVLKNPDKFEAERVIINALQVPESLITIRSLNKQTQETLSSDVYTPGVDNIFGVDANILSLLGKATEGRKSDTIFEMVIEKSEFKLAAKAETSSQA